METITIPVEDMKKILSESYSKGFKAGLDYHFRIQRELEEYSKSWGGEYDFLIKNLGLFHKINKIK